MTATVIPFPADRCRQPLSVREAAEQVSFSEAVEKNTTSPEVIRTMIELSIQAGSPAVQRRAASWLLEKCNLRVTA